MSGKSTGGAALVTCPECNVTFLGRPTREQVCPSKHRFPSPQHVSEVLDRPFIGRSGVRCSKAPEGWECSREEGHDGPCAAHPVAVDDLPLTNRRVAQGAISNWQGDSVFALLDALCKEFHISHYTYTAHDRESDTGPVD